jgi:hypothetical protein
MIQREKLTVTVSGGVGSANTKDLRGLCGLIVVVPVTATTSYDLKLTDELSVDVYERKGNVGTLRDATLFPLKGIYTVTLSNVSANENHIMSFYVEESP